MQSAQPAVDTSPLSLLGAGHFHPENVIDNDFLEALDIGVDPKWIVERVGIESRRTVLSLDYIRSTGNRDPRDSHEASSFTNAQTGAFAARMAIERASIKPGDIGWILSGGCSPQHSIPAEACKIGAELGIECPAFDLNSACSTFAAQMHFLNCMRREMLPEFILLTSVENTTRTVDYRDRRTAVLWGDGSSAVVVSPRTAGPIRVVKTVLHSDPSGWDKVVIPVGSHFEQDGPAVQSFAIRTTLGLLNELEPCQEQPAASAFVGHQANALMLEAVCRRARFPVTKHFSNVTLFGNTGASGAPGVLSQNWDSLPSGYLRLAVVGSGLTWGGMLLNVDRPA